MESLFSRDMERAKEEGSEMRTGIAAIWDLLARGSYERIREVWRMKPAVSHADDKGLLPRVPERGEMLRRIAKAYLVSLVLLTLCLLTVSALRQLQAGDFTGGQGPKLILLSIPFTAAMTVPMSVFLAVSFVALGVARAPREVRLQSAKTYYFALLAPTLLFSAGIGLVSFALNTELVPRANAHYEDVRYGRPGYHGDRSMTLSQLQSKQYLLNAELLAHENALKFMQNRPATPEETLSLNIAPWTLNVRETKIAAMSNAIEIHKKYALAVACVVLSLAAVALTPGRTRHGTPLLALSSVAVFTFYYICLMAGESMAEQLLISPWQAMWAANEFILISALLLLWYRFKSEGSTQPAEARLTM
ncbi:MAG: LptF/LptG family permease [Gemmatimonadaceae bacterium]|nr:LptF/LptG family permease [Gemmatimonadaceae bacterium]